MCKLQSYLLPVRPSSVNRPGLLHERRRCFPLFLLSTPSAFSAFGCFPSLFSALLLDRLEGGSLEEEEVRYRYSKIIFPLPAISEKYSHFAESLRVLSEEERRPLSPSQTQISIPLAPPPGALLCLAWVASWQQRKESGLRSLGAAAVADLSGIVAQFRRPFEGVVAEEREVFKGARERVASRPSLPPPPSPARKE